MKLWNDFDCESQIKAMNLIEDLLLNQTDNNMQEAIIAALEELKYWSAIPLEEK